ncbi:hypothetical protein BJ912DRAFT_382477 [Pholiota molesta]|nr:hypothetical protein BJ912DRAFT_382477 [Pholiota molesta]
MRWHYHRCSNKCCALHAYTPAWHAPPVQHSSMHGAEEGTTSVRFSRRCHGQTASGLYTPSPSHSPDGIWTLATSSPGAAGAGFYTIVATSQRSRVHGFSFDGDVHVPHASLFYRKWLSHSNGNFPPTYTSVLRANPVRSRQFWVVFFASSHFCEA